jgi:hypothetical protein
MTGLRSISLLLLFLLTACAPSEKAAPEPPAVVDLTFSTNGITIGDPVEAILSVRHPVGARVEAPDPSESESLTVRRRETRTTPVNEQTLRTDFRYWLTSFSIGDHLLSTQSVNIVNADGVVATYPYPSTPLTVRSVIEADAADWRADKPLLDWPGRWPRWIPVLLLIVALAVIIALFASRFLNKPRTILHYPPPPPPHVTALNALKALREKQYIEREEVEPFFVELSLIVRRYIEDRFRLRAPEQTTEEFIREAASARVLTDAHQSLVHAFLEQCDLVKFARHRPGAIEMNTAYDAAERLVHETTPAEVSP